MFRMSKKNAPVPRPKSLAKGLLAGLIGGLVGVVAMATAEHFLPRRAQASAEPPEPPSTLDGMHWSFGAAVGAAYGVAAEYFPAATSEKGAAFGMALESLSQEGTLPALGLLTGSTARGDRTGKMTSHVVYGIATEVVRGFVRKHL
jgi:putative membrane protein